jgi:hypothetical protein
MTCPERPPSELLRQMTTAYWTSQAIYSFTKLGLADLLAGGPERVEALAEALSADAAALDRLLRAVAGLGVVERDHRRWYRLTVRGELLRSDVPSSMRAWAIAINEPWYRAGWDNLVHSVLTGRAGFDEVHGTDFWSYLANDRVAGRQFDAAMTSASSMRAQALLEAYDFSNVGTVVDVGGGHGALLAAILAAYPDVRGVLFDRPQVIAGATALLEREGVANRCRLIGGDFFEEVPDGGDVYVLAVVVHDWTDEPATAILASCRRAMPDDARILLVEQVIPDGDAFHQSKLDDLNMLVTCRGRERSADEFRALFARAGLELTRILPTSWQWSVIEGTAA